MDFMEITISSKIGLLPPTRPVFPLCGTTANRLLLQYFNIAETSSVDFGFSTHRLAPVLNIKTTSFKHKGLIFQNV